MGKMRGTGEYCGKKIFSWYCGGRILWWGDLWGEYSVDGEYAYVGSYKWEGIFWLGNIVMGRIFWVWDILDGGVLMGNTNPNLFFLCHKIRQDKGYKTSEKCICYQWDT